MAKRSKKGVLNQVLGMATDITGVLKIVPTAQEAYAIGKDVYSNSVDSLEVNSKKDKMRKLIYEIGDRIYTKKIDVNDKNIQAEIDCIKELESEINNLKSS